MLGDLTTIENVTAYAGAGGGYASNPIAAGDTAVVKRLISAASKAVLGYLNRGSILSQIYVETRSGNDQDRMTLRRWPVTAYTSLSMDGTVIPVSPIANPPTYGWRVEDLWDTVLPGRHATAALVGECFWRGVANIVHTYVAGYLVANEPQVVPATPYQLATSALMRPFAQDAGVTYANGVALKAVASAPAQGQYVAPVDVDGFYLFNAADVAAAILVSYSFTPEDIAQVTNELVVERYAYLTRVGVTSQKAGMSAETYGPIQLTALAKETLNFYRDVIPV